MFDPYHKWFGIAPKDKPPNHYRLLAIDRFESDPEVIDAAANRQMAYLHNGLPENMPIFRAPQRDRSGPVVPAQSKAEGRVRCWPP